MSIFCLFKHKWQFDKPLNIRDDNSPALFFTPILFLSLYFGPPKVCDVECKRCGKIKTISYPVKNV